MASLPVSAIIDLHFAVLSLRDAPYPRIISLLAAATQAKYLTLPSPASRDRAQGGPAPPQQGGALSNPVSAATTGASPTHLLLLMSPAAGKFTRYRRYDRPQSSTAAILETPDEA
jgi:hypothetical protein